MSNTVMHLFKFLMNILGQSLANASLVASSKDFEIGGNPRVRLYAVVSADQAG